MTKAADMIAKLKRTYRKEYVPTGSTVGDISNRLRQFPILAAEFLVNPDGQEAADFIAHQERRIEALREALGNISGSIGVGPYARRALESDRHD